MMARERDQGVVEVELLSGGADQLDHVAVEDGHVRQDPDDVFLGVSRPDVVEEAVQIGRSPLLVDAAVHRADGLGEHAVEDGDLGLTRLQSLFQSRCSVVPDVLGIQEADENRRVCPPQS